MRHPLLNRPLGLVREMDRLFDSMLSTTPSLAASPTATPAAWPPINVWEDDDAFHVEAELPGLSMDAIDLDIHDDTLTIAGGGGGGEANTRSAEPATVAATIESSDAAAAESDANSPRILRRERSRGAFTRALRFNATLDVDAATARLDRGVLRVTLPKAARVRPRRIPVQSGPLLADGD